MPPRIGVWSGRTTFGIIDRTTHPNDSANFGQQSNARGTNGTLCLKKIACSEELPLFNKSELSCSTPVRRKRERISGILPKCPRISVDAPGWVDNVEYTSTTCECDKSYNAKTLESVDPHVEKNREPEQECDPLTLRNYDILKSLRTAQCAANQLPLNEVKSSPWQTDSFNRYSYQCKKQPKKKKVSKLEPSPTSLTISIEREINEHNKCSQIIEDKSSSSSSSSSSKSSDSMPPPDFILPRREIVEAIKYHELLGRALCKLVLNKEINERGSKPTGACSFTSMSSSWTPTEALSTESSLENNQRKTLGVSSNKCKSELSKNSRRRRVQLSSTAINEDYLISSMKHKNVSPSEKSIHDFSGSCQRPSKSTALKNEPMAKSSQILSQKPFVECSVSQYVAKRNINAFFHHFAGIEDDIKKFYHCEISSLVQRTTDSDSTTFDYSPSISFFPTRDDLKSPPSITCSLPFFHDKTLDQIHIQTHIETITADSSTSCLISPPGTPLAFSPASEIMIQPYAHSNYKSNKTLEEIAHVKEDLLMMLADLEKRLMIDFENILKKELKDTFENCKGKCEESDLSAIPCCNWNVDTLQNEKLSEQTSSVSPVRLHFAPSNLTPNIAATPRSHATKINNVEHEMILKEMKKLLCMMESNIIDKISLQMGKGQLLDEEVLGSIIDKKVAKLISQTNVELQQCLHDEKMQIEESLRPLSISSGSLSAAKIEQNYLAQSSVTDKYIQEQITSIKLKSNHLEPKEGEEVYKKILDDSFSYTMRFIDDFVSDCNHIVKDFDDLAFRMQASLELDHDNYST